MHWTDLSRWEKAAPSFQLRTPDGATVTRAQFRHRNHLVLIFVPPGDGTAVLEPFAAHLPDFAQASAVVYAVAPGDFAPTTPVPLLLDPGGQVRRSYADQLRGGERPTPGQPLIAIVDRFGVLSYLGVADIVEPGTVDEALAHVWGLEYECPE